MLYGLTYYGGINSEGTIFSYDISNRTETVLHSFGSGSDGIKPIASLIQASNGVLYGTTTAGGIYGYGIIFSYNILTGEESDIHDFASHNGDSLGAIPYGTLIHAKDTLLYGMTQAGGIYDKGVIFSYNISTVSYHDIYDFGNKTDASIPLNGPLIQVNDSFLYAMTSRGGVYDSGTIFSYNIITKKDSVLHSFGNHNDGSFPDGSLIQASNGLLYGMTSLGGANDLGIVFSFNTSTNSETVMHDFSDTDGASPFGNLLEVDTPTTGINQLSATNTQLSIYPNPTSGQFTIKANSNQNGYMVEIYNLMGEEVYVTPKSPKEDLQKPTINLSSQPAGLYFVYLKSDEGVEVGKVVVTK